MNSKNVFSGILIVLAASALFAALPDIRRYIRITLM